MSADQTPRALRHIIAIIGCRNVGKSSLINALTEQDVAIVSPLAGTTTDVVAKAYELLPLGPVTFYDTAGLDDNSFLGEQRIKASLKILYKADIALLVVGEKGLTSFDKNIIDKVRELKIPIVVVFNKNDKTFLQSVDEEFCQNNKLSYISVSAEKNTNIVALKDLIINTIPKEIKKQNSLLEGLIKEKDRVVLVTPLDKSAPKNRLILPQVQVLREILDLHAFTSVTQLEELSECLLSLKESPKIVIADSQVIIQVSKIVPQEIDVTTFSILFARFKGDLRVMVEGSKTIDNMKEGAKILISEACSHHAQDDDIARVKIPALIAKYTGKHFTFSFCTGCDFPDDLEEYNLVIHCGACMLTQTEMRRRLKECISRGVPITNYGIVISKSQGVLERVIKPFNL